MKFSTPIFLSALASAAIIRRDDSDDGWNGDRNADGTPKFQHVAAFSIDGLHASDIDKWLAKKGTSTISKMLQHGYRYTNAFTTFPSDSFPGTLAQYAGAFPRTTGLWYDDIWDKAFYPPNSNCVLPAGAEGTINTYGKFEAETKFLIVAYDESLDFDPDKLFSGGINASNLPEAIVDGKCQRIYPHQRPRVNNAFEIVVAAGKKTAYTDKHPAYDLVRGPSGTGLSTGYFPEINSIVPGTDVAFTANVSTCMQYDELHVKAFLTWLDGKEPPNSEGGLDGAIPTLWGGNFQSVSVGQKTAGYIAKTFDFTPQLETAVQFVDESLGAVIDKLKDKKIYDETLMIVCSKHGQSPIDPGLFKKVDPKLFTTEIGVKTSFITFDDIALIFLENRADLDKAVANLNAHKSDLSIDQIIYGQQQIDLGFGDATKDSAVPDIIVQPIVGTIYTTSKSKIEEHGGNSENDRHVACFAHNPKLHKHTIDGRVYTTQVAPTILKALGFDPQKLQGVKKENTQPLPGFGG
jgi:hypothetical protein